MKGAGANSQVKSGAKSKALRYLLLLAVLAAAAAGIAWRWAGAPERAARRAAAEGRLDEALAQLERAATRPGGDASEAELRAMLLLLLLGRSEAGTEGGDVFEALASARALGSMMNRPPLPRREVGRRLLAAGREAELATLTADSLERAGTAPAWLRAQAGFARHAQADVEGAAAHYRAALEAGLGAESGPAADRELAALVETQLRRATEERRSGRVVVIRARDGAALAWRPAGGGELAAAPELEALLGGAPVSSLPGLRPEDLDGGIELALDPTLQRRAMRLFRRERGAFVALDPTTGELLAAAAEPEPAAPLAPFVAGWQPGSTLKVLTLAAFLDAGLDAAQALPHDCRGNDLVLEGEILYDWAAHGHLETFERALATSCNSVFARAGLALGEERLREALRPFGFGADAGAEAGPEAGEGLPLRGGGVLPTGALAAGPLGPRRLARTAMGLDATRISPVQAAAIALALGRGGELPPLVLVKRRLNVVGAELEAIGEGPAPRRACTAATASTVLRAMERVVSDPDGTGRGVQDIGVSVAMKTGTTGGDGEPLNAAFLGLVPAESPRLAFSLFTQESGRSLEVSRRVLAPFLEELIAEGGLPGAARGRGGAAAGTN